MTSTVPQVTYPLLYQFLKNEIDTHGKIDDSIYKKNPPIVGISLKALKTIADSIKPGSCQIEESAPTVTRPLPDLKDRSFVDIEHYIDSGLMSPRFVSNVIEDDSSNMDKILQRHQAQPSCLTKKEVAFYYRYIDFARLWEIRAVLLNYLEATGNTTLKDDIYDRFPALCGISYHVLNNELCSMGKSSMQYKRSAATLEGAPLTYFDIEDRIRPYIEESDEENDPCWLRTPPSDDKAVAGAKRALRPKEAEIMNPLDAKRYHKEMPDAAPSLRSDASTSTSDAADREYLDDSSGSDEEVLSVAPSVFEVVPPSDHLPAILPRVLSHDTSSLNSFSATNASFSTNDGMEVPFEGNAQQSPNEPCSSPLGLDLEEEANVGDGLCVLVPDNCGVIKEMP